MQPVATTTTVRVPSNLRQLTDSEAKGFLHGTKDQENQTNRTAHRLEIQHRMWMLLLSLGIALTSRSCHALSIEPPQQPPAIGRRTFVNSATAMSSLIALTAKGSPTFAASKIGQRLEDDKLVIPPPSYASELKGVDNTYFPSYLAGTWDVTQTLVDVKTPLGLKFAGGPNGDMEIAKASLAQSSRQFNRPVQLQLRYIPTKWGVAEDRLFNVRQRLDAFAGKVVVASVEYANVGGSNRQSVLALGGQETDPLQTTVVRFKGPAAQKSFIVSHGGDPLTQSDEDWSGYELQRSIFALTNQNQG